MRRRRVLEVELNRHDSIVRGPGVGQILTAITGRPPMYFAGRRGYGCQERTARDVIAAAERLNFDVVITGPRTETKTPAEDKPRTEDKVPAVEPEASLW